MFDKKEINGRLNLFLLHDEHEDSFPKRWIRVPLDPLLKSSVRDIIADISKEVGTRKLCVYEKIAGQIETRTGYGPSFSSIKAWINGAYNTPLIFLRCLLEYHAITAGHDDEEGVLLPLLERMSSGSRTSWVCVKIPNTLTTDLAYFLGIIAGDGSLPNVKDKRGNRIYEIKIESASMEFLTTCYCSLVLKLFEKRPRLLKRTQQNGRVTWQAVIGAKPIFRMLTRLFDMPVGRKYEIVRMPILVKNSNPEIWASYIRGLFDTDGSVSGGSRIAFYSRSRGLLEDVGYCLRKLTIGCEFYEYHKRKQPEFHLYVSRNSIDDFISLIGSGHPIKEKMLEKLAVKHGTSFQRDFKPQSRLHVSGAVV